MTEKDPRTDIDPRQNHKVCLGNQCYRSATKDRKENRGVPYHQENPFMKI